MSYRQCVFAFPTTDWTRDAVLAAARAAAVELAFDVDDLPAILARINDAAWAEACGAWLLMFGTTRDSDRVLERGFFLDYWSPPFSLILHDDQNGHFLFHHVHPDDELSIGSDGALHGDVDRVTVLPDQHAVAIGVSQVYGKPLRYLDLLYTKTAWRLYDPDERVTAPTEIDAPLQWRNYVDAWPGDDLARTTTPPTPARAAQRWLAIAGRATDPLRACTRAAERAPDDAEILAEAGRLLVGPHPREAVALLTRALARNPGDLVARYNRACAHGKCGDKAAMLDDLRACIAAQPGDAAAAAADEDLAAYHDDPDFRAVVAGPPFTIASSVDEAYAVVPAPGGHVLLRVAYTSHERARLDELAQVPPPDAITPEGCAAYGDRLASAVARHPDLSLSVLVIGRTPAGIHGWLCGVARVWRLDDGEVVSPSPYLEVPPGVNLPADLICRGVTTDGVGMPAWFEAAGERFAVVMAHPLPEAPPAAAVARGITGRL